jgi:hypothetical protein
MLREGALASGTHDPLLASLVWVRDAGGGGGQVLWIALDALAVDAALAASIAAEVGAAAGCDPAAVVVCASHTHSSAAGWVGSLAPSLPDTADEGLRRRLISQLAEAAGELPRRLEPCSPLFGEGRAESAGSNRNDPAGPHDPSVGVLGLVDAEGRLMAVVMDYASHATVLGHANVTWSADWPGAARRALADALSSLAPFSPAESNPGPRRPVVAVLQGAAGDASPRFVRRNQRFGEVDRLGALVAAAGLDGLLAGAPQAEPCPIVRLERTIPLPTRRLPDRDALRERVALTERAWHAARSSGAPAAEERIARTRHEGALMLLSLADAGLPPTVDARVRVVAIGEGAWVHLPVELFASLGLAIRAASPFRWTRLIGYSDAYLGYVADEAAHRDGVYEALASRFDADAGAALTDTALALLREATERLAQPVAAAAFGTAR